MIATVFIIGVSFAMLVYWFRHTVILILRTRSAPEYAQRVATANQLSFVDVRQQLHTQRQTANLSSLCGALQRDYQVLKYLLGHAASPESGYTAEQRLLMLNFRLMTAWFAVASRFRPNAAKLALLEMSGVLEYFANVMGRRFASLATEPVR